LTALATAELHKRRANANHFGEISKKRMSAKVIKESTIPWTVETAHFQAPTGSLGVTFKRESMPRCTLPRMMRRMLLYVVMEGSGDEP
jgi:hypothetical protein